MQRGGAAGHRWGQRRLDRKKGFAEAIKNAPNIKIIARSQVTSPAVKAKKSWRALSSGKQRQKHLHGLRP